MAGGFGIGASVAWRAVRSPLVAVVSLAAVAGGWLVVKAAPYAGLAPLATWGGLLLLFCLGAVPFLRRVPGGKRDYLEPIYLVSLSYILYFGLRVLYVFYRPENVTHPEVFDLGLLSRSLGCVDLGVAALLLAYYGPLAPRLARRLQLGSLSAEWPRGGFLQRVLLLYAAGVAVRWVAIGFGVSDLVREQHGYILSYSELNGGGRSYLANFQEYTEYALFALMLSGTYRRSKAARAVLLVLWLLEALFRVPTTSKRTLFVLLLMIGLWLNYRKFRIRGSSYAAVGGLAVLLIFPWVNTYRGIYGDNYTGLPPSEAIPKAARDTVSLFGRMGLREYLDHSVDTFFSRAHGIDSLCLIVKYTPGAHGFLKGSDYLNILPVGLVPRALWPGKPSFHSEEIFELYYWRGDLSYTLGAFPAPTMVGDFYMNFGLAGVVVGMFFTGFIYRFLYEFFVVTTGASSPGLLFYFVTVTPLLQVEATIMSLSGVLKRLIYVALFDRVLRTRLGVREAPVAALDGRLRIRR